MAGRGSRLAAVALLAAFAAPPDAIAAERFAFERFFAGRTYGAGSILPVMGKRRLFTSTFEGTASARAVRLRECFRFEDGSRPCQVWRLDRVGPNLYRGTLTTATSPVTVTLDEGGATIDYDGRGPDGRGRVYHFRHRLTANADGTVSNAVRIGRGNGVASSAVTFAKRRSALER